MLLHLRPLGVCQYESIHPKLESQPSLRWNPDSQQPLALQLPTCFEMRTLSGGLVRSAPE
jgi:hypothetical protein